jgi:Chitin binding Peritrophin-A domain
MDFIQVGRIILIFKDFLTVLVLQTPTTILYSSFVTLRIMAKVLPCDICGVYTINNFDNEINKISFLSNSCGPHRVFEPNFKACVLEGSTRNIRNGGENVDKPKIMNASTSNFNCSSRKPGKYPDENDCHIYHLCLRSDLYSPFEHLEVKCPHSTAYDHHKKICSKKAWKICSQQETMNIYCEEEIRFRETRSCSHYFLCYQNQVIEFLCPPGFQFDENLQFCEPKHFVDC